MIGRLRRLTQIKKIKAYGEKREKGVRPKVEGERHKRKGTRFKAQGTGNMNKDARYTA